MALRFVLAALALAFCSPALAQPSQPPPRALPDTGASAPLTREAWIDLLDENDSLRRQRTRLSRRLDLRERVIRTLAIDVFDARRGNRPRPTWRSSKKMPRVCRKPSRRRARSIPTVIPYSEI